MASIVSAGTTSATALNMSADTSGVLQLASNNGTVALTVTTAQGIGIGTTSVASGYKVDVNGKIKATNVDGPSFSAVMSTGQSLTAAANVVVQYTTAQFNNGNFYNATGSTVGGIPAYAFKPTTAGYYFVQSNVVVNPFTSGASEFILRVAKNGTETFWSNNNQNATGHYNSFIHTSTIYLNGSSDYIQMLIYSQETQQVAIPGYSQFTAFLLKAD